MNEIYDIVIVGAGPAGLTAALYAKRAEKNVLLFEKNIVGGQVTHSPKIENYPGMLQMSGLEFANMLSEQVKLHGAEIIDEEVTSLHRRNNIWNVIAGGKEYKSKSVVIATGAKHRTLGLDRENELEGLGVSYCAVCDGAFYKDQTVAVIGGGNSALQESILLSGLCKKVYVIQNLDFFTGEWCLVNTLKNTENVEFITGKVVTELLGQDEVTGIVLKSSQFTSHTESEERVIDVNGIFVAIGLKPDNDIFSDVVNLSDAGYIISDEKCILGNGLFVAGDCRTKDVRQITTAVSDGATAALAACKYISSLSF